VINEEPVGWISYAIEDEACEIVAIYSEKERQGIGTTLINKMIEHAKRQKCTTVWLLTTNDNTDALRFYQKRGFTIQEVQINEMERQRKRKPIPLIGNHGIPLRDEIKLEMSL